MYHRANRDSNHKELLTFMRDHPDTLLAVDTAVTGNGYPDANWILRNGQVYLIEFKSPDAHKAGMSEKVKNEIRFMQGLVSMGTRLTLPVTVALLRKLYPFVFTLKLGDEAPDIVASTQAGRVILFYTVARRVEYVSPAYRLVINTQQLGEIANGN